jgi:hypothetical protein
MIFLREIMKSKSVYVKKNAGGQPGAISLQAISQPFLVGGDQVETFVEHEERDTLKPTASSALRHPMRVRILEVVNERDMSPVEFLHLRLAPEGDKSQKTLSHISYHFRQLAEDGERVPRRGATQHVYRGRARIFFDDEEWAQMSPRERSLLSRAIYQGIAARADGALMTGTFDSRPDRHLSWDLMDVDEQGWTELMAVLQDCFYKTQRIRREAEERLASSDEGRTPVTIGLLGFESPQLPGQNPASIERPVIASG